MDKMVYLNSLYDIYKALINSNTNTIINSKDHNNNTELNFNKYKTNLNEKLYEDINEIKKRKNKNNNNKEVIKKLDKDKSKLKQKSKSYDVKINNNEKEIKIENIDSKEK